jgi:UPF0716 protein FxsA
MAVLLLVLIALPVLEIFVIVQVAHAIGGLWTVLLLLGSAVLGMRLLRLRGAKAYRELREAVEAGRPPARQILDGVLSLTGAALLVPPGFVTSAIGLILLLPLTRFAARWLLLVLVARRWRWVASLGTITTVGRRTTPSGPLPGRGTGRKGAVVDGEVVRERSDEPRIDPPT